MRSPSTLTEDPRVRLFRRERPGGVARARNWGIREARASWTAFLDDDDVWAPSHLEQLLGCVRASRACWGFSRYVVTTLKRAPLLNGPSGPLDHDLGRQFLRMNPVGTPSCALVATDTLRSVGGFDERLAVMADWDLWLRLAASWRPAVSAAFTVGYAYHRGSMTLDIDRIQVEREYMAVRHRQELQRLDLVFGDSEYFWRWLAFRCAWTSQPRLARRYFREAAARGGGARDITRAMTTVPVIGSPIRLARAMAAMTLRRSRFRRALPQEHAWLQAFAERAGPGGSGRTPVTGAISQRWRVRARPSP